MVLTRIIKIVVPGYDEKPWSRSIPSEGGTHALPPGALAAVQFLKLQKNIMTCRALK